MASLTLAKVGARAGFGRGIANHHFGSKAQLVAEFVEHVELSLTTRAALSHGDGGIAPLRCRSFKVWSTASILPRCQACYRVLSRSRSDAYFVVEVGGFVEVVKSELAEASLCRELLEELGVQAEGAEAGAVGFGQG